MAGLTPSSAPRVAPVRLTPEARNVTGPGMTLALDYRDFFRRDVVGRDVFRRVFFDVDRFDADRRTPLRRSRPRVVAGAAIDRIIGTAERVVFGAGSNV